MRIIHFSGLRLGAAYPDWPDAGEKIRGLQRDLLVEVFERAAASSVSLLLCSGDLFDSNAASLSDVRFVIEACKKFPGQTLVVLPGGCDPWAPYCVHRHLGGHRIPNLLVLFPESACPTRIQPGVWIYSLPEDATASQRKSLKQLERKADSGWHIAIAYGDRGRLQPGPEEGLVMAPPEVATHPFDYLALADGGPAERVGTSRRPTCYAAPLVKVDNRPSVVAGASWQITLSGNEANVEPIKLDAIVQSSLELDVTRLPGTVAIAQAIRREADPGTLFEVRLVGTRSASSPILEPELSAYCSEELLGVRIHDETRLVAPDDLGSAPPLLRALWNAYAEAPQEERSRLRDAIKLVATGRMHPGRWREAPWAHSL